MTFALTLRIPITRPFDYHRKQSEYNKNNVGGGAPRELLDKFTRSAFLIHLYIKVNEFPR